MSHSKTKKFISGFVALALALSIALGATTVQALTSADIDLLAALGIIPADKVAAAKAAIGGMSGGSSMMGGYVFAPDLKLGSRGTDVWNLQRFLNSSAATQVAATGPGSPGSETQYFGPATQAAVKKFQAMHGVPSIGYVGTLTRAELNKSGMSMSPSPSPSPSVTPPGTGLTVAAAPQQTSETVENKYEFGFIKAISKRNGVYYIDVGRARYDWGSQFPNNYRITDLKESQEFQVAPDATVTLVSDTLTQFIDSGVIKPENLNGPHLPTPVLFSVLAERMAMLGFDWANTPLINMSCHFSFRNGLVVQILQQYIP